MSFSGGVFSINTAGQPVVAGTSISASVFNAFTADIATGLSTCLLKDGTQTATAVIPFASGLSVSGGSTFSSYVLGSTSTTFTWNGTGGTSGAVTVTWQKVGQFVVMSVPAVTATTGTSSSIFSSDTAIAAGGRPANTYNFACPIIQNNGAVIGPPGMIQITSAGIINIYRDSTGTATFTNSASAGVNGNVTFMYFVG